MTLDSPVGVETKGRVPTFRTVLANLTFALSVFCYLKLVPIDAEIQPFAALPALALILLYPGPLKVYLLAFTAIMVSALAVSVALAYSGAPYLAFESVQSFVALWAPVVIFVAILGNTRLLSARVFVAIVGVWVLVGFSQVYLPVLQTATGLDSLLSKLISRYSTTLLRDWGRGATLLAPEPSYSARTIFLFTAMTLFLTYRGTLSRTRTTLLLAACAFLTVANQSATVVVVLAVYLALLVPVRKLAPLVAVALLVLPFVDLGDLRFVQVARTGYDLVAGQQIGDILDFTNAFGSQRTISVTVAYSAVVSGRYFGGGLGSWSVDFVNELSRVGFSVQDVLFYKETLGYIVDVKPYSHVAMMAFELGFIGIMLDVLLLLAAWRLTSSMGEPAHVRRFIMATVTVSVLFLSAASPVSAPEFWVTLALALSLRTAVGQPPQVHPHSVEPPNASVTNG